MGSELIPPGLTYLADNIASKQNILGVSGEQSVKWAKDLNLPKRSETPFSPCNVKHQFTGDRFDD